MLPSFQFSKNLLSRLSVAGSVMALAGVAGASAFTPGNLVVVRVGDGVAALTNAAQPVFLDEYTTAGALVQTIALPTTASAPNFALTMSGTATSEGALVLSGDGNYLTLGGYDAVVGTAGVASTATTTVARVFGRVALDGTIDTSTTTTSFSANNIRGVATSNGTDLWAVGANTGVVYQALGGSGAGTVVSTTQTNNRVVSVIGGQLFVSSGSGTNTTRGVNTIGTGTPTTTGQSHTRLTGLTDTTCPSTYGYFFADLDAGVAGDDTLYLADDGAGAITKFCLVAGTWTTFGTVGTTADDFRGLAGRVSAGTVELFVTRLGGSAGPGGGEVVTLSDATGYSGTLVATPTVLATAVVNTAIRGIALIPASGAPVINGYCFGDGSGTACPCANSGAAGNGCANSINVAGASLTGSGVASISGDTLVLSATGMPNAPGLYFQGTTQLGAGNGVIFGDGLRCVGGAVVRLGIVTAVGNASSYPSPNPPAANAIPISIKGLVAAGNVRNYQLWYRDSGFVAGDFCTPAVFNLTNGLNLTWAP